MWNQDARHQMHILINAAGVCLSGRGPNIMRSSFAANAIGPIGLVKAAIRAQKELTVINVSSGEGEVVFIESNIVKELDKISSSVDLDKYIDVLQNTYNPSFDYAHGPSPMYSVSKAILNKSTQLLHKEHGSERDSNIRILSCCPGNVASPMSTEDELNDTVTAEYAAEQIFKYATEPEKYPGGRFYRDGKEIPW